ncbi:MAG: vWA domain-containing protein, partial [Solirubrobacteraceae bacterium]
MAATLAGVTALAAVAGIAGVAALLPAVASAAAKPGSRPAVSAWLTGAAFPRRTLVLSLPTAVTLTPKQVHVTENGAPAGPLTLTPVTDAPPGATGIVAVIDAGSAAAGAPLHDELLAVRRLAALRRPGQLLGVVGFAAQPRVLLSPTASASEIANALAATPATARGANPGPAVATALA